MMTTSAETLRGMKIHKRERHVQSLTENIIYCSLNHVIYINIHIVYLTIIEHKPTSIILYQYRTCNVVGYVAHSS